MNNFIVDTAMNKTEQTLNMTLCLTIHTNNHINSIWVHRQKAFGFVTYITWRPMNVLNTAQMYFEVSLRLVWW